MSLIKNSLLIVDDEPAQRQLLRAVLERDYKVTSAASGEEAQAILKNHSFDLVLTDQKMPGLSGVDLLLWIKENLPEIPVIFLTAFGTINSAVEAMKLGAEDYLAKPIKSPDELRLIVKRCLEKRNLIDQTILNKQDSENRFPHDIVAASEEMRRVLDQSSKVAAQSTTVLLTGESGTGKEVVARYIHRESPRSEGQFVAVNCAALTETLLESELFGHEKGAFTGAISSKRGRFELAHGGTLFLDEIGEMGYELQSKLLRVLQNQEFERVGGTRTITVDVRVIAATNKDLDKAMKEGAFREDLFYRLSVFPINIPPLRERRSDILPLAEFFVNKISTRMGTSLKSLSDSTKERLLENDWPGNIRELQNSIERALIVSQTEALEPYDLALQNDSAGPGIVSQPRTLAETERITIIATLERNQGDRKKTATELGISLRTLQYRLKDYGLTG